MEYSSSQALPSQLKQRQPSQRSRVRTGMKTDSRPGAQAQVTLFPSLISSFCSIMFPTADLLSPVTASPRHVFFVPRTHARERYGEGEPPKPCWGLGTYRDGRVCSDPPLPARLPPRRESEATLVVRGPPSTRSLMLLNRSPGKVGPSNAVPCFCCITSPAER